MLQIDKLSTGNEYLSEFEFISADLAFAHGSGEIWTEPAIRFSFDLITYLLC